MPPLVSIVICTYNRDELITEALSSLVEQTVSRELYEIIVVNNNSTDRTVERVLAFSSHARDVEVRLITETEQGLSYARNRGYREAAGPWIVYMDDDARAPSNFVARIVQVIEEHNFDCFGGVYYPWYLYGKPKWFKNRYASNGLLRDDIGPLPASCGTLSEDGPFLSGGIFVIKKQLLEEVGGFPVGLGMKGDKVAYGEETMLQIQLLERGYSLGFDPELSIEHLVPKYKLNVRWFLKSAYSKGEVSWASHKKTLSWLQWVRKSFAGGSNLVVNSLTATPRVLITPDYYRQNWAIDVLAPLCFTVGQSLSGLKQLIFR